MGRLFTRVRVAGQASLSAGQCCGGSSKGDAVVILIKTHSTNCIKHNTVKQGAKNHRLTCTDLQLTCVC